LINNNYSKNELINIANTLDIDLQLLEDNNKILNYIIFDDYRNDYQKFNLEDFLIYNEIKEN
jgi:hypothetical protein